MNKLYSLYKGSHPFPTAPHQQVSPTALHHTLWSNRIPSSRLLCSAEGSTVAILETYHTDYVPWSHHLSIQIVVACHNKGSPVLNCVCWFIDKLVLCVWQLWKSSLFLFLCIFAILLSKRAVRAKSAQGLCLYFENVVWVAHTKGSGFV